MKPTQEILERIRDLAGLKRLEFGCEVKKYQQTFTWLHLQSNPDGRNLCTYLNRDTNVIHSVYETIEGVEEFEIIGLPVQLNDLLRVIDKQKGGKTISIGLYSDGKLSMIDYSDMQEDNSKECEYNLTLTVEQNLETNPDLRSLISNLIF